MDRAGYTVGWIAPLSLELTAAEGMVEDGNLEKIEFGGYVYFGGKIGQHYVVMAVQSRMGTDAASDLAARMRSAFRNIEYFLVVGIGGGVPSYGPSGAKSEIVLGDVVVSYPASGYGGVIRYDFGAWTSDGHIEIRGHTNAPFDQGLGTVNSLRAHHHIGSGTNIPMYLQEMRMRIHKDERSKFEDPGERLDWLFPEDCPHPYEVQDQSCEACCDLSLARSRQSRGIEAVRKTDSPKIHYGNIGSGNQLQISAHMRNRLLRNYGIICFEMEGAGVIQKYPCLVVRGICDYSDSHKNKLWQAYAAATAAAYAKEFLTMMPRSDNAGKWREPILSYPALLKHFLGQCTNHVYSSR